MRFCITKFLFIIAITSILTVSCKKDELSSNAIEVSKQKIEVKASACSEGTHTGTKTPIYGTSMPIDRFLKISAVYHPAENRGVEDVTVDHPPKNYFKGATFSYNASKKSWSSEQEPLYWPLTGTLDFLAFSSDQQTLSAEWGSTDDLVTKKLTLTNFDDLDKFASDDLLYGTNQIASPSNTAVPIVFKHAKALIIFTAKASFDDAIKITAITLHGIQTPSELKLTNNPPADVELQWTFPSDGSNLVIPGIDATNGYVVPRTQLDVTKKSGYFGIGGEGVLLAPQDITSFTVNFSQKTKNGAEIHESFTYDCKVGMAETKWQAGKRYIYELDFNVKEINVAATVEDWNDYYENDKPYVIDLPEVARIKPLGSDVSTNLTFYCKENTKFLFHYYNCSTLSWQDFLFSYCYSENPRLIFDDPSYPRKDNIEIPLISNNHWSTIYVSEKGKVTHTSTTIGFEYEIFDKEKFVLKYQVTYKSLGNTVGHIDATPDSLLTKIDITPSLDGKRFVGWFKDEDGTQEWDFDNDKVERPMFLYAKFENE